MARKKIDDSIRNQIRMLLNSGNHTIKDIAYEFGISEITVKRIKKELSPATVESSDFTGSPDNSEDIFSSTNKNIIERFRNQQELEKKYQEIYEDSEEGWVYNLKKDDHRRYQSSLWWSFIFYPESVEEDWEERFKSSGLQISISPIHDKDRWTHDSPEVLNDDGTVRFAKGERYKCGDKKKAHYHGLIKVDTCVKYNEMNDWVRNITHGPYIQKCLSLQGAYNYFTHKGNPDKYQYDDDEIKRFNNFVLEPNEHEKKLLLNEIMSVISDNREIDSLKKLFRYYRDQTEYVNIIAVRSYAINALLKDNEKENFNEKHPNGVTKRIIIQDAKGRTLDIDDIKKIMR